MNITKTVKAQWQNSNGSISVTIPKQIVSLLDIKYGDLVEFNLDLETMKLTLDKLQTKS